MCVHACCVCVCVCCVCVFMCICVCVCVYICVYMRCPNCSVLFKEFLERPSCVQLIVSVTADTACSQVF